MINNFYLLFSPANIEFALRLVSNLENLKFRCWLSPRNLLPGEDIKISKLENMLSSDVVLCLVDELFINNNEKKEELLTVIENNKEIIAVKLSPDIKDEIFTNTERKTTILDCSGMDLEKSGETIVNHIISSYPHLISSPKTGSLRSELFIDKSKKRQNKNFLPILIVPAIIILVSFIIYFTGQKTAEEIPVVEDSTSIKFVKAEGKFVETYFDKLYFCNKYDSDIGEIGVSSVFSGNKVTILIHQERAFNFDSLYIAITHTELNDTSLRQNLYEIYKLGFMKSWNFLILKDILLKKNGIYRVVLFENIGSEILSSMLIISNNETYYNTESTNQLFTGENIPVGYGKNSVFRPELFRIFNVFTPGSITACVLNNDIVGDKELVLNIEKYNFKFEQFEKYRNIKVLPPYNQRAYIIEDINMVSPGIYRLSLFTKQKKLICDNLVEIRDVPTTF